MNAITITEASIDNGLISLTFSCTSVQAIENGVDGVPDYVQEALLISEGQPVQWLMTPRIYEEEYYPTTFGVEFKLGEDYIEDTFDLDEAIDFLSDISPLLLPERKYKTAVNLLRRAAADWWQSYDNEANEPFITEAQRNGLPY